MVNTKSTSSFTYTCISCDYPNKRMAILMGVYMCRKSIVKGQNENKKKIPGKTMQLRQN